MAIESDTQTFSSFPAIVLGNQDPDFTVQQFIAMDPPKHDEQRKAVTPTVSPRNLALMEASHSAAHWPNHGRTAAPYAIQLGLIAFPSS